MENVNMEIAMQGIDLKSSGSEFWRYVWNGMKWALTSLRICIRGAWELLMVPCPVQERINETKAKYQYLHMNHF